MSSEKWRNLSNRVLTWRTNASHKNVARSSKSRIVWRLVCAYETN